MPRRGRRVCFEGPALSSRCSRARNLSVLQSVASCGRTDRVKELANSLAPKYLRSLNTTLLCQTCWPASSPSLSKDLTCQISAATKWQTARTSFSRSFSAAGKSSDMFPSKRPAKHGASFQSLIMSLSYTTQKRELLCPEDVPQSRHWRRLP